MAVSDMVIALNEADQVIDVAPQKVLLEHIISHFSAASTLDPLPRPRVMASTDRVIQFFDADGEKLQVIVSNAWQRFEFATTGKRADVDDLRARILAILDGRFKEIAGLPMSLGLEMPTGDTWVEFLQSCADLVEGKQRQPGRGDPHHRRGWWHNTFAHGGKPWRLGG